MSFLPFEDFYILNKLTQAETQERLQSEIKPNQGFSFKKLFYKSSKFYFSGYVSNRNFVIEPIIYYRNDFLPEVKGTIEDYKQGSRIHIKMALKQGAFTFMFAWFGGAFFLGIWALYMAFSEGRITFATFGPAIAVPLGYVIVTLGFKFESSGAKNKLLTLLDGEIE